MCRSFCQARSFSLLEVLVVVGVISLLLSILLPAGVAARREAKAVACAANLRAVGQGIHAFAEAHDDYVASVIRERDYYWDRGKQIGWDIETGRWADIPGGRGTIWQCPQSGLAYVGNARALGLDNREALPNGLHHRVGPRQWYEPARLVLCYDLQPNLTENAYAHALDPASGDLSDETYVGWPVSGKPTLRFELMHYGPHAGGFSALFADGHGRTSKAWGGADAVYWSGAPWWK